MFTRSKKNPIITPDKSHVWEAVMTYNPGVIYEKDQYHLFYRAVGRAWISKIGYAVSRDGETFKRFKRPLFSPKLEFEKYGLEDPRITKVKNTYCLTYTAYDGQTARLCLMTSPDLKNWQRHGEMLPNWSSKKAGGFVLSWDSARRTNMARQHWVKAGGIFPEQIKNKYWMLFGDRNLWLATANDLRHWKSSYQPLIQPRHGRFDNVHVEMGPPPIKTERGWLVLYHGIDKNIVYRLGCLLLDLNDPTKILYRSQAHIFEPKKEYSLKGIVDILPGGFKKMETMSQLELNNFIEQAVQKHKMPKVTFCPGAILINKQLRIYFGASDSVICTATAKLTDILNAS